MQTSDIERTQTTIFLRVSPFASLVYPANLRAAATIYIVTGGAVLYSPFTSAGRISDEISRANMYNRAEDTPLGTLRVRACALARAYHPESLDEKFTRPTRFYARRPVSYRSPFGLA